MEEYKKDKRGMGRKSFFYVYLSDEKWNGFTPDHESSDKDKERMILLDMDAQKEFFDPLIYVRKLLCTRDREGVPSDKKRPVTEKEEEEEKEEVPRAPGKRRN
eukprot:TRINITY_DN698_c1_g1_i7.p4 TRINITY_DN698_c1_g1~~TRINITY_DN698_c1_g1_i7.p4  ORF type:complete len:103 (+),score=39.11 TRINITY_DN698_c1_g1_i7:1163-1471(+)